MYDTSIQLLTANFLTAVSLSFTEDENISERPSRTVIVSRAFVNGRLCLVVFPWNLERFWQVLHAFNFSIIWQKKSFEYHKHAVFVPINYGSSDEQIQKLPLTHWQPLSYAPNVVSSLIPINTKRFFGWAHWEAHKEKKKQNIAINLACSSQNWPTSCRSS